MSKQNPKKSKLKKDNILILLFSIILIVLLITLGLMAHNIFGKDNVQTEEAKVVDEIKEFDYYLTDHNTKYYKELFEDLKKTLTGDNIDEEKYASLVAQLFTADFYDLNSKLSKNDVGGTQFILPAFKDTMIKKATSYDGIYYYVKSDLYGNRSQDLPVVKKAEVSSVTNETYAYGSINDPKAYKVVVNITYERDLGYQKTVNITLVHYNNKLHIVEIK